MGDFMPKISALGKLRQEDSWEFKASPRYIVSSNPGHIADPISRQLKAKLANFKQ